MPSKQWIKNSKNRNKRWNVLDQTGMEYWIVFTLLQYKTSVLCHHSPLFDGTEELSWRILIFQSPRPAENMQRNFITQQQSVGARTGNCQLVFVTSSVCTSTNLFSTSQYSVKCVKCQAKSKGEGFKKILVGGLLYLSPLPLHEPFFCVWIETRPHFK